MPAADLLTTAHPRGACIASKFRPIDFLLLLFGTAAAGFLAQAHDRERLTCRI
jgi:hypothetical protein